MCFSQASPGLLGCIQFKSFLRMQKLLDTRQKNEKITRLSLIYSTSHGMEMQMKDQLIICLLLKHRMQGIHRSTLVKSSQKTVDPQRTLISANTGGYLDNTKCFVLCSIYSFRQNAFLHDGDKNEYPIPLENGFWNLDLSSNCNCRQTF